MFYFKNYFLIIYKSLSIEYLVLQVIGGANKLNYLVLVRQLYPEERTNPDNTEECELIAGNHRVAVDESDRYDFLNHIQLANDQKSEIIPIKLYSQIVPELETIENMVFIFKTTLIQYFESFPSCK